MNNYRGITVSSVIAKVLESAILEGLLPTLWEAGILHLNQSSYFKGVSCADAVFTIPEVIARYMLLYEGSMVHMCLYDLSNVFDSVEYPVLL